MPVGAKSRYSGRQTDLTLGRARSNHRDESIEQAIQIDHFVAPVSTWIYSKPSGVIHFEGSNRGARYQLKYLYINDVASGASLSHVARRGADVGLSVRTPHRWTPHFWYMEKNWCQRNVIELR